MKARLKDTVKSLLSKDYGNGADNSSYQDFGSRKRLMKFNRFFSQIKVLSISYMVVALLLILFILYIANRLYAMRFGSLFTGGEITYVDVPVLDTISKIYPFLLLLILAAVVGYFVFLYNIRVSFGSINIGQKGTARWTTREEIAAEYKLIPEKDESFPGCGGIPVAREEHEIYIDDSNTNSLVIGSSRSGKGEIIVKSMIDNLSRAKEQASMIITDPKMELSSSSIPTLKKRGYDCYLLNLVDPIYSMFYNPLSSIIRLYEARDYEAAQMQCTALASQIFVAEEGDTNPYFVESAGDVFMALVWAEIEDNILADRKENTRYRREHDKKENEREEAYYKELYGLNYENYLLKRAMDDMLDEEPYLSDEALIESMIEHAKSPYYDALTEAYTKNVDTNRLKELRGFKYKKSNFKRKRFYESDKHKKTIHLASIQNLCVTLHKCPTDNGRTALDYHFTKREEGNFAQITYGTLAQAPDRQLAGVVSTFDRKMKVFITDNIAKLTSQSSFDFIEIPFNDRPVAVFLGLPDYDRSTYALASLFVSQMGYALGRLATAIGGELPRRVHFILDEFGNLPAFGNIRDLVSVGLGRGIVSTFVIQSLAQLEDLYDKKSTIIKENCGNQVFIKTSGLNTSEEYSKLLGKETISVINRTGKKLAMKKELTEMSDEDELLSADELTRLEKGEMVVLRYMKREDKKGEPIMGNPISNLGEYRMKYAYTFLSETFPQDQLLYRSPNLMEIISHNPVFAKLEFNIVDVGLPTTSHVDLKRCSRSGTDYLAYLSWRVRPFPAGFDLGAKDRIRMNQVFNLLNLSPEQREIYMFAGTETEEGDILYEAHILRYEQLEDYAWKLIGYTDSSIQEKGYQLLHHIMPLKAREQTEEERREEERLEQMLLSQMRYEQ